MKKAVILLFFSLLPVYLMAGPYESGTELFNWSRFAEAKPYMEAALSADPQNKAIIEPLFIIYKQLGEFDKALSLMQKSMQNAGYDKAKAYFFMGEIYKLKGEKRIALEMYNQAVTVQSTFAEPYLSRANIKVGLEEYKDAVSDYERFLVLKPLTPQRPQIEAMIAALKAQQDKVAQQEQEQQQKEKKLLQQILDSLNNASQDTKDLTVDPDVILEEDEGEIGIE